MVQFGTESPTQMNPQNWNKMRTTSKMVIIYEFKGFKVRYELKLMIEDEIVLNR